MRLKLHDTTIYFKGFYPGGRLSQEKFQRLCSLLAEFPPIADVVRGIRGLNLVGDHYYRNILFAESGKVGPDEVALIDSITPIIDQGELPYILERNRFEAIIPAGEGDLTTVLRNIEAIDRYIDQLLPDNYGKKIEIHLKGALGRPMSRLIGVEAIPRLPAGDYEYTLTKDDRPESGGFSLPAAFDQLPDGIRRSVEIILGPFSLKIRERKNILVLKTRRRIFLGVSIYSDRYSWFADTLSAFDQARILAGPVRSPAYAVHLPHF